MVVRVYGKCEGRDIIFTQDEASGRWQAAVPASPTGVYIIELWAEDWAGNIGYYATIKIIYDPTKLCYRVEVLDVGASVSVQDVFRLLEGDKISTQIEMETVNAALGDDPVSVRTDMEPIKMELGKDPIWCEIIGFEVCGQ